MPTNTTPAQPKKLLDKVRDEIRFKHYSLITENTYISWIKQYILLHGKRHPTDMEPLKSCDFDLSGDSRLGWVASFSQPNNTFISAHSLQPTPKAQ